MAKSINHLATADNLFFGKGGSRPPQDGEDGRRRAGRLRRRRAVPRIRAEREPGVRRRQAEERLVRHHPGLRPAQRRGRSDGLRPCLGARRAGAEARRRHRQGGARRPQRRDGRDAARHQPAPLCRRQPDRRRGLRQEGGAVAGDRRLRARQGAQGAPGLDLARGLLAGRRDHQGRRLARRRRPPAGAAERQRGLRRRQPHGGGQHRLGPARRLWRHLQAGVLAARGRRGDPPVAGQPAVGAGAGRRDAGGAGLGLVGRAVARGGRPRAGRRLPSQEDVDVHQHDGRHDRLARRHRGR